MSNSKNQEYSHSSVSGVIILREMQIKILDKMNSKAINYFLTNVQ